MHKANLANTVGPHSSRLEQEVRDGLTRHGLFFQAEPATIIGKPDIVLCFVKLF